jgi:hypothetical protein
VDEPRERALAGGRRTARTGSMFEHRGVEAVTGELDRRDEPVVSGADHQDAIHPLPAQKRSCAMVGRSDRFVLSRSAAS